MTGSNWREMFEPPRQARSAPQPAPADLTEALDDVELSDNPSAYSPWTLQRGRNRPAMMLHLRRYEPRSGLWMGWAMSYPNLAAVEYVGDRMLTLDFGSRQFVVQGAGLDQVVNPLQQGAVLALHEYNQAVWSAQVVGPVISSIRLIGPEERALHADA